MNKEEFKAKREIINSKMNELKNEMIKLEKEYIESNVKYERKQYAYVRDYKINFLDDIEPLFGKVKKDGTMSNVNLYVSLMNVTIELVKE